MDRDWLPVSVASTLVERAAEEAVAAMAERWPGVDWGIERRSRPIREEPYVEHTYHLIVPRWQAWQARRVWNAYLVAQGYPIGYR